MPPVCAICAYPITEQHHILPRSMGGSDDPENLIALCPNHHTALHICLTQLEWQFKCAMHDAGYERRPRALSERHRWLFSAVSHDQPLIDYLHAVVMPLFEESRWPFYKRGLRRSEMRIAKFRALDDEQERHDEALYRQQLAWRERSRQKATPNDAA